MKDFKMSKKFHKVKNFNIPEEANVYKSLFVLTKLRSAFEIYLDILSRIF